MWFYTRLYENCSVEKVSLLKSFSRFPIERRKAGRRLTIGSRPSNRNRELRATPIFGLRDDGSPVDRLGFLPVGAFPLLESFWPTGSGDREKARFIVNLLKVGLRQDSEL